MVRVFHAMVLAGVALASVTPSGATAQLISPGQLAGAHQQLEGIRRCTSCHQLGKSGVSAALCLDCHQDIAERIRADRGYHAVIESEDCASCHQDHLGRDFQLVRLDPAAFDHAQVGYPLEGGHAGVDCRSCHVGARVTDPLVRERLPDAAALDRTFLGLSAECAGCHVDESPHGDQLSRACAECHEPAAWDPPVGFDHRMAAFPLEGRHAGVACASCHGSGPDARYRPLAFASCADCHADPHRGAMQGACASCHGVDSWHSLRTAAIERAFDHARTAFALRGAHQRATCTACHASGRPPRTELVRIAYRPGTESHAYPLPVAEACASCHTDRHAAPTVPRRWIRCAECHTETLWAPSSFVLARHEETTFALTGAHETTPCVACHAGTGDAPARFALALERGACADCHADEDPHGGRYAGMSCETCHATDDFQSVAFDHAVNGVDGAGGAAEGSCAGCHEPDDPHAGQFAGVDCATCHVTDAFAIEEFDHGATRFVLDGAHERVDCGACHRSDDEDGRVFVRYRPLGVECADCHGEGR